MNKRGQALIEFVLILPIFLFLIFAVYDFGRIFVAKNALESTVSDTVSLYRSGKTLDEIRLLYKDLTISMVTKDDYDEFTVKDKVKIITPGLNRVFGNPYEIEVVRYIPHDE